MGAEITNFFTDFYVNWLDLLDISKCTRLKHCIHLYTDFVRYSRTSLMSLIWVHVVDVRIANSCCLA